MTTVENVARDRSIVEAPEVEQRQVWDLPVRLFHWTLALAIVAAFVTNRLGVDYFKYHVWCGYAVVVLVLFRIIWGFVGTRHALFWNFVRGPIQTLRYALKLLRGEETRYAGHNPLGAWMVVTLLIAIGVQAVVGLFGDDEIFNVGPLYGYVAKETALQLTSLHRKLFYWIAAAIAVHVLAVIAHHVFKQENLARAIVTGRKPHHEAAEHEAIHNSRSWLAALLVIAITVSLFWVVEHAPISLADASF
jgi:cytochrome b